MFSVFALSLLWKGVSAAGAVRGGGGARYLAAEAQEEVAGGRESRHCRHFVLTGTDIQEPGIWET